MNPFWENKQVRICWKPASVAMMILSSKIWSRNEILSILENLVDGFWTRRRRFWFELTKFSDNRIHDWTVISARRNNLDKHLRTLWIFDQFDSVYGSLWTVQTIRNITANWRKPHLDKNYNFFKRRQTPNNKRRAQETSETSKVAFRNRSEKLHSENSS